MIFTPLDIPGAFRIDLERREDERGFFARLFCDKEFSEHGLVSHWTQMNVSFTHLKGTVRGLHFQQAPGAEAKLVRCVKGAIFDVVVDLRRTSSHYGRWTSVELDDTNRSMVYVPERCAHGFQTLSDDCELLYMHSVSFAPLLDAGLRHDDPSLAIAWPLPITSLSTRDRALPSLSEWEAR